jgi:type IV pilus assembly protein PilA
MFCSKCGAQLASGAAFCSACGADTRTQTAAATGPARPGQKSGAARSSATTVLIVLAIVFGSVMFIGIVAAIAIPGLLRARMAGNEAVAIGSMRSIVSAEAAYFATAGKGGYATRLAVLSKPCPGSSDSFISPDLSHDPSVKSGYGVKLESAGAAAGPPDCNGTSTEADYYASAAPLTPGTTGNRGFSSSASGTIFFDVGGDPPSRADTLGGTARRVQ